jgi:predicted Zn-dependent protease
MRVSKLAAGVAFSVILASCASAAAPPPPAGGPAGSSGQDSLSLLSVEDEIALGKEAQSEVRKQVPALTDRQVTSYMDGVFRQLARHAGGPEYPYSVSVANFSEVNAFALPGGPVWVHRGAVEAAVNEAQLAGVLGHEIAHIARRHVAEQITKQTIAGGLLSLLGRFLPENRKGQIGQMAASLVAQGVMLKFSRDHEREADREGMRIMRGAGWDARGLPEFLEVLRAEQGRDPSSVEVFLSNHPGPSERAADLRAGGLPSGGRRDSTAFQRVRARLRALPPAPKMEKR